MKFSHDQQAALIDRVRIYFINNPDNALWVEAYKPPRTHDQRAQIHCIMREIANYNGSTECYVKEEILKGNCDGSFPHWPMAATVNDYGEIVFTPRGESSLTSEEERELIERLHAFGGEYGMNWSK